jgi:RCC1 and BTB domain-containing protein
LGHGHEKNISTPTALESIKNPKDVVCGYDWTTVLTANGVYSFGYGANGRLGIGNDTNQLVPVHVDALNGLKILQIACGHHHTIVITEDSHVFAWGYGGNGRLGNGSEQDEKKPKEIEALKGKSIIFASAGAYHSAVINSTSGIHFTYYDR